MEAITIRYFIMKIFVGFPRYRLIFVTSYPARQFLHGMARHKDTATFGKSEISARLWLQRELTDMM